MNAALRREYLSALGIESWSLRSRARGLDAGRDTEWSEARMPARSTAPTLPASVGALPPPAAPGAAAGPPALRRSATQSAAPPAPATAAPAASPLDREAGVDWAELTAKVAACRRCSLCDTRTQTVFGVGDREAQWLVVGEAPGQEEDRRGEPFVGRAGQLLNSMLRALGFGREQVYIANVLKCRPPNNRDPTPFEAGECLPYLEQQIALIRPKIMLAVGRIAAQNLLRTDVPLGRLRQQVHRFGHSQVPLVVTYHPAYLLRTPGEKRKAWEDLKFAREVCARV